MLPSPSITSCLFFTELQFKITYLLKKKKFLCQWDYVCMSSWEMFLILNLTIWLRCCDYWLQPFPMSPSYITAVIFLWMLCHAFKLNCLRNVLIPSDGMWTQERAEAKAERKKEKRYPQDTKRERCLHNLSELVSWLKHSGGWNMPTLQGFFFSVKPAASAVWEACINGVLYQCFVIILCCLIVGLAAVITLWNCGKRGTTIHLLLRNSIVTAYNVPPCTVHY